MDMDYGYNFVGGLSRPYQSNLRVLNSKKSS